VTGGGATKSYVGGIEYSGAILEAIYHGEGRITPNGTTAFFYEYTVKDHLGNARVNFRANGTLITNIEDHHYYPFGMKMEGIGSSTVINKYTYNYKELNEDFGLNLHDYGARWYDGTLGRWWSVDPLAEPQANYSPYAYTFNNPLSFIDPTGMMPEEEKRGADDLTNSEWIDQTRKDGGYWANTRKAMEEGSRADDGQTIQDFDGNKHRVGRNDLKNVRVTPYGTRVMINGVIIADFVEGYNVVVDGGPNSIRPVTVTITDQIVRTATLVSYPDGARGDRSLSQLYEVPTYRVTVSGTDNDGVEQLFEFEALRFGIQENAAQGIAPRVVGLSRAQTHILRWNRITTMDAMAWRVTRGWFIHEGPRDPATSRFGSIGCIEICGAGQWTAFNDAIRGLAGSTNLGAIGQSGRLQAVYQAATPPPLVRR
jgi:RHS repeat-associated protein